VIGGSLSSVYATSIYAQFLINVLLTCWFRSILNGKNLLLKSTNIDVARISNSVDRELGCQFIAYIALERLLRFDL
jgi:hypothetical protein